MDGLCFDDMDENARELDDPLAELEQDIAHQLLESWGTNLDAPDRSIGLEDQLSAYSSPNLKNYIEKKLLDDDRISAVQATITQVGAVTNQISLSVEANEDELGIVLQFDGAGNVVRVAE